MGKLLEIKKRIRKKNRVQKYKNESFEIRDAREKEFFIVDDAYMNGFARICGVHATCVYLVLCRHAGKEQTCFPSVDLIMNKINISRATAIKALKVLEFHNIIKIDRLKGQPNIYILTNKKHWRKLKTVVAMGKKMSVTDQAILMMKSEPGCEAYPDGALP